MKNTSTFQIALIAVFVVAALVAVVIFATSRSSSAKNFPAITIWGTLPQDAVNTAIDTVNKLGTSKKLVITYVQKQERDFDRVLTEALASGAGPDAILFPHTSLYRQRARIFQIPESSLPLRTFKDTYIDQGDLFLAPGGLWALPVGVDPLVMYWNKSIFAGAGLAKPPRYWDEFLTLSQKLTKRDGAGNIVRGTVAFGEFANVTNAKELLSTLFMQAGTPIVSVDAAGRGSSQLAGRFGYAETPAQAVLNFYTQFSNPAKTTYSWNRSLKDSQTMFLGGDLALHFAFVSDFGGLSEKNPNLNFDVAPIPQQRDAKTQLGYGRMYGLAAMKAGKDVLGTITVLSVLSGPDFAAELGRLANLTPARRDLLSVTPADPVSVEAFRAALISRAWLDPEPVASTAVFKHMVEGITSGKYRPSEAVSAGSSELQSLLQ